MVNNKPVLSLGKKIKLFKDRNLVITDSKKYGYQWFINGYNDPFMKNFDRNKNWYDYGSSSQSIIELFECDKCLRFKFLEYTE